MILLDTNIIIYYLKGNEIVCKWLENKIVSGETFAVSTLSVVELFGFKNISAQENIAIKRLLQTMLIVDADIVIANEAGKLRQQYNLRTIDAVIAASAKILNAELVTNDKNLRKVLGMKVTGLLV